ncbi:MAG TPA: QueT transporter family protein [Clostridia bacterium]|nr:QueT transporter family protein [Clostridia bacterium]
MIKGALVTKFLARTGLIAALYAVFTIVLYPISYGPVQCRISETMTLLPLFFVEAIPGLIIGCLIANIFSGVVMDMVFGTLATALAAVATYFIGKAIKNKAMPFVAAIPPVLFNALILPLMWMLFTDEPGFYWYNFATVMAGQVISVYILGIPLFYAIKSRLRHNISKK